MMVETICLRWPVSRRASSGVAGRGSHCRLRVAATSMSVLLVAACVPRTAPPASHICDPASSSVELQKPSGTLPTPEPAGAPLPWIPNPACPEHVPASEIPPRASDVDSGVRAPPDGPVAQAIRHRMFAHGGPFCGVICDMAFPCVASPEKCAGACEPLGVIYCFASRDVSTAVNSIGCYTNMESCKHNWDRLPTMNQIGLPNGCQAFEVPR